MLENLKDGLTAEAATAICERLMPQTRASTIAITDTERVLACVGDMVEDFPPGSPIHTRATHYVIEHGLAQSFMHGGGGPERGRQASADSGGDHRPAQGGGAHRGSAQVLLLVAAARQPHAVRAGHGLCRAALLRSSPSTSSNCRRSSRPAPRFRALQAQINPHFLFNTLNTIASFTRTRSHACPRASARVLGVLPFHARQLRIAHPRGARGGADSGATSPLSRPALAKTASGHV